jgi:hypothetical protein
MKKPSCRVCTPLRDVGEIVDSSFPPEFEPLQILSNPYSDERILKCPQCHTYFYYRKWSPGGSEDAMRTYVHESLDKMKLLDVHLEFDAQLAELKKRAEQSYSWKEDYDKLFKRAEQERQYLREYSMIIIQDAIACIKEQRSTKVPLCYLDEVRQREQHAAAVLEEYCQNLTSYSPTLYNHLIQLQNSDNLIIQTAIKKALTILEPKLKNTYKL